MQRIDSFFAEHRFLSNFWPSPVRLPERWCLDYEFEELPCDTVEHGYQACKTLDPEDRFWVMAAPSPFEAKKRGQRVTLRDDWEQIKLDVMWDLLVVKFSDPELRAKLVATGDAELVEGNHWGDTFWGVCRGVGTNYLGRLLMDIRAQPLELS